MASISAELARDIERELVNASRPEGTDSRIERAEVLVAINQAIYDHISAWHPCKEGNDRLEREAIGKVLLVAELYLNDLVNQLGDLC